MKRELKENIPARGAMTDITHRKAHPDEKGTERDRPSIVRGCISPKDVPENYADR